MHFSPWRHSVERAWHLRYAKNFPTHIYGSGSVKQTLDELYKWFPTCKYRTLSPELEGMTSSLASDVRETMRLRCQRSVTFPHVSQDRAIADTCLQHLSYTCREKQGKMLYTSQSLLPFIYIPHLRPNKPIFECKNVPRKFPNFLTIPSTYTNPHGGTTSIQGCTLPTNSHGSMRGGCPLATYSA